MRARAAANTLRADVRREIFSHFPFLSIRYTLYDNNIYFYKITRTYGGVFSTSSSSFFLLCDFHVGDGYSSRTAPNTIK